MSRLIRLWGKKRGARRTGSKIAGTVGEAMFFASLFLIGTVSLAALIASRGEAAEEVSAASYWGQWLVLLVVCSFIFIGGAGVILTVMRVATSIERRSALAERATRELLGDGGPPPEFPTVPRDDNLTNSPGTRLAYRLPVLESASWQLAAAAAFCLISSGVAATLLGLAVSGLLTGRIDWFLTILAVPAIAVGGVSTVYLARQIRAQTRLGRLSLEISAHPLRPGQGTNIFLSQLGRVKLASLEILLICEETATYRQGTDIRTETCLVFRESIFRREKVDLRPGQSLEELVALQMPAGVMHSFQSAHNMVNWKLVVRGESPRGSISQRSFPIVASPPFPQRASA